MALHSTRMFYVSYFSQTLLFVQLDDERGSINITTDPHEATLFVEEADAQRLCEQIKRDLSDAGFAAVYKCDRCDPRVVHPDPKDEIDEETDEVREEGSDEGMDF